MSSNLDVSHRADIFVLALTMKIACIYLLYFVKRHVSYTRIRGKSSSIRYHHANISVKKLPKISFQTDIKSGGTLGLVLK